MLDASTVGEKLPQGQTRHWLVNGARVSGMCCYTQISCGY